MSSTLQVGLPTAVAPPSKRGPTTDGMTGWAFIAPFLAAYVVLMVYPTLRGIWLSLHGSTCCPTSGASWA